MITLNQLEKATPANKVRIYMKLESWLATPEGQREVKRRQASNLLTPNHSATLNTNQEAC